MGAGDRRFLRPRTAVLAVLAAALLIAVVLLKGSDPTGVRGTPKPPREAVPEPGERPSDARPEDPRKRSATPRPPPPKPPVPGPAESRARSPISVRVLDPAGKPRGGIPIDLVAAEPGGNPGRALDATRFSDPSGAIAFPWPKAGGDRDMLLSAGMIIEEPLVVSVPRVPVDPVEIRIPESGEATVSVTDGEGRPFLQPFSVLLLVATNDPWPAPAALERASRPAVDGKARIPLIEAGTLLLVEGRTSDPTLTAAPKLIEGPAREGAVVETTLVVRKRPAPEGGESRPTDPRFVRAHLGPPSAGPARKPNEGSIRFTVRPKDALPQWPIIVQVGLRQPPAAMIDRGGRVDVKGNATVVAPAGRYVLAARLWRAMPDGWVTADFELAASGQPALDVVQGRQHSVEIALDPQALSKAAAALMGW